MTQTVSWDCRSASLREIMSRRAVADRLRGGIYVIVDPDHTSGRSSLDMSLAVINGGAAAIQLRRKNCSKDVVYREAEAIAELCGDSDTLFIVNDYPDIAADSGAHGVHVGQNDLSVSRCREFLKDDQLVGKSNALVDEALSSERDGADYIAVGSIFHTDTKSDTRPAGLSTLRKVAEMASVPVVAIGGINISNIASVAEAGADAACVATAVTQAKDAASAVSELREAFASALNS